VQLIYDAEPRVRALPASFGAATVALPSERDYGGRRSRSARFGPDAVVHRAGECDFGGAVERLIDSHRVDLDAGSISCDEQEIDVRHEGTALVGDGGCCLDSRRSHRPDHLPR
jgi:hypothetical protein